MRLLALDTATEACSVAVLTEAGVLGVLREVGRGHADEILPMIDGMLAEAGITLGMVDAIVAGVGPGSFTGVRISVSVAQGLAFGAGVPVIAVNSLEALAMGALAAAGEAAAGGGDVLTCLDARMGEVYWGCFSADAAAGVIARTVPAVGPAADVWVPFGKAAVVGAEPGGASAGAGAGVVRFAGVGRGFAAYPELMALHGLTLAPGAIGALPDARDMVRLGALRYAAGWARDAAELAPLYVRDKVALTEAERAAARVKSA
jgi:tRNA threonylcarbamoyladenosine biosynthesis protein TsaB